MKISAYNAQKSDQSINLGCQNFFSHCFFSSHFFPNMKINAEEKPMTTKLGIKTFKMTISLTKLIVLNGK